MGKALRALRITPVLLSYVPAPSYFLLRPQRLTRTDPLLVGRDIIGMSARAHRGAGN
jgi:hypothetical protein